MSDIEQRIGDFLREEAEAMALSNQTYEHVLRRTKVRRVITAAMAGLAVIVIVTTGIVTARTLMPPADIGPATTETPAPSPSSRLVDGCPVTLPPQPAFVPPKPYPSRYPNPNVPEADGSQWYGTPELWTILDQDGAVWRDLPVAEDGRVGDKTLWFSANFSTAEGEDFSGNAEITVTAVHLDGSAPTVVEEGGGPSFNPAIKNFMLVGLELPEPGCWEVTARYQGAELSYVLLVED